MSKIICPRCNSTNTASIIYGFPSPELITQEREGKVYIGGCEICVNSSQPDRYCNNCKNKWSIRGFISRSIRKVRFTYYNTWDVVELEGTKEGKWAFDIYPDGRVEYHSYPRLGRKIINKGSYSIDANDIKCFYKGLIDYRNRNFGIEIASSILDGDMYDLTITYGDNRKSSFSGAIGDGKLDKLVVDLLMKNSEIAKILKEK